MLDPGSGRVDDRLAPMDQGSFLGLRALGHQPYFLATWCYDRPVDLDEVRRFNENLAHTLLGRLVQRSPVPGGRHRWVRVDHVPAVEVEREPRERGQLLGWTDEFACRGVDPEFGPGWRLGVLPFVDGGAAVSFVVPHTLGDGLCVLQAIEDAVLGRARLPGYPTRPVGVRGRRIAGRDAAEVVRDVGRLPKALAAGARLARAQADPASRSDAFDGVAPSSLDFRGSVVELSTSGVDPAPAPAPVTDAAGAEGSGSFAGSGLGPGMRHGSVAGVRVDQAAWDAVAKRLGGTSNTLVQAFSARIAARLGRVGPDGAVTLAVPVSVRRDGDTRANALAGASVRIDPTRLPEDLTELRAATKSALRSCAEQAEDLDAALPLVPLTPPFVVRRTEATAMGAARLPVGCSNYGDLSAALPRIDGATCDDFWVRLVEPGQTSADIDRIGGQLYVLSGRVVGSVFLSVLARPVGGETDRARLLRTIGATLAEFDLVPSAVDA